MFSLWFYSYILDVFCTLVMHFELSLFIDIFYDEGCLKSFFIICDMLERCTSIFISLSFISFINWVSVLRLDSLKSFLTQV